MQLQLQLPAAGPPKPRQLHVKLGLVQPIEKSSVWPVLTRFPRADKLILVAAYVKSAAPGPRRAPNSRVRGRKMRFILRALTTTSERTGATNRIRLLLLCRYAGNSITDNWPAARTGWTATADRQETNTAHPRQNHGCQSSLFRSVGCATVRAPLTEPVNACMARTETPSYELDLACCDVAHAQNRSRPHHRRSQTTNAAATRRSFRRRPRPRHQGVPTVRGMHNPGRLGEASTQPRVSL